MREQNMGVGREFDEPSMNMQKMGMNMDSKSASPSESRLAPPNQYNSEKA